MECPTCGRSDFSSERGMKSHHKRSHGGSLAGELCECAVCGDEFRRKRAELEKTEKDPVCSYECNRERQREGEYVSCECCGGKFYKQPYFLENRDSHYCSKECSYNSRSGPDNNNWRGGTDNFFDNDAGRAWRRAVFKRDNFTCQDCGDDSGGNLNAHHIKRRDDCDNFEKYAVWNGVTVCKNCHAERHKGERVYEMLREIAKT